MKNWVVILLLIVFFPVGLFLMWAKTNWKNKTKIIVTVVIAVLSLLSMVSNLMNYSNTIAELESTIATTEETKPEITTVEITTIAPTTIEPTTEEPTTEEPTTEEPTTEEPTTEEIITEPKAEATYESSLEKEKSNNNFLTYDNEEQQNTNEYVLNTNTKKVHKASCSEVKKIASKNYATISNLEDAYAQGYKPCKKCNP